MENTYTYTARSAEHPERVVTFTLYDGRVSVGAGVPLEQVTRIAEAARAEEEGAEEETAKPQLWLKPLAVSLVEQSTTPFRVVDIDAGADDDWLLVRGWIRMGGLRLAPITLMSGQVDNVDAAHAFVAELGRRKKARASGPLFLNLLDYWATWFVASTVLIGLFNLWRKRQYDEEQKEQA
ncbi:MAG: hypothetical protein JXB35_01595 [Anaerolineae bacterium]|nr:hypothetical protein [Anaerolineae bacterium]